MQLQTVINYLNYHTIRSTWLPIPGYHMLVSSGVAKVGHTGAQALPT